MFVKLGHSNPKFEVSPVDVEEWINANKGIAMSRYIIDGDIALL